MQNFGLAFGIFLTIARLGTILNNQLTPVLAQKNVGYAFLVGLIFILMSAISYFIFTIFEKYAVKTEFQGSLFHIQTRENFELGFVKRFDKKFWILCINISLGYIGFQSFNDISKEILSERY